jgi:FkbM family methyltransferase
MWLDSFLYRNSAFRDRLSRLIPDRERAIRLLGREFYVSPRFEIGLVRLAALLRLSPTAHELGSLISIAGLVPRGGSFVDVGANVGFYSVPIASIGDIAGLSVFALEPNKSTAARLRKNLAPYRCATVLEVAASSKDGSLDMGYLADSSATFQVSNDSTNGAVKATAQVAAIRLDGMAWPKPWVLKIDVEGHEAEALAGLQKRIDDGTVTAIMFDGFADKTIPERLRAQGFSLFDGRTLRPFTVGHDFNLLAIREHRGGAI